MTKILAIDSSTEACSVALCYEGKEIYRYQHAPRKHAELLLPMVDELLNESGLELSELDAIACCVGPGAFTGLRIAVSVAQGLAFAANLQCIPVSSLHSLAVKAFKQSTSDVCFAAIDARMKEVYFALYRQADSDGVELIGSEKVLAPELIDLSLYEINLDNLSPVFIGNGWQEYTFEARIEQLDSVRLNEHFPSALDMLEIAKTALGNNNLVKPEDLQPVYLRNNVAKKKLTNK